MNKNELVEAISKETDLPKTDVAMALNATIEVIKKQLVKGKDVTLMGFGTFTRTKRKARVGKNPRSGEEIKIPATTVPKFRPGRELKDAVR